MLHIHSKEFLSYRTSLQDKQYLVADGRVNIVNNKTTTYYFNRENSTKSFIVSLKNLSSKDFQLEEKIDKYPQYLQLWLNIHENQYQAAHRVIQNYLEGNRYCMLIAQMQSGKTGTAKYVTHYLLHCMHDLIVDPTEIYFICAMNDNDLRNQAIKEFIDLIPESRILFSKQLQDYTHSEKECKASLIIIDESHYGSCKNSQIDKFMKNCVSTKPFVLSVSATPMAELATSESRGKTVVRLEPGPGYYGIRDIFANANIYQAAELSKSLEPFCDIIEEEYERQYDDDDWKYCIVRLPNQWYFKDLEEALVEDRSMNIKFINHHSQPDEESDYGDSVNHQDFNKYISKAPEHMTIIWIYGSLRAGKQLNTEHVSLVHDTASSKPDTIAQALLGRIFGYGKEIHDVKCYTDLKAAKSMLNWVEMRFDRCFIPKGSRNVLNGYTKRIVPWKLHPPIMVDLPDHYIKHYRNLKEDHGIRYPYKDDIIVDMATFSMEGTKHIVQRVLNEYKPGEHGGLMILTERNTDKSFNDHWKKLYAAAVHKKPIRAFHAPKFGEYYYIYMNLNKFSPKEEYGKILLTYKEYVQSTVQANYASVNTKSMYVQEECDSDE